MGKGQNTKAWTHLHDFEPHPIFAVQVSPPDNICEATGKRKFLTQSEARLIARETADTASAYRCDVCLRWHVGRPLLCGK